MMSPSVPDDAGWREDGVLRFLRTFRKTAPRTPAWLEAEQRLLSIPVEYAAHLIDAFEAAPQEFKHALRGALSKLGSSAYYDLIGALRHDSDEVRLNALELLYGIAQRREVILSDAVIELAEALIHDADPRIRRQAAATLECIGADAENAVEQLRRALADCEAQVREWAALALGSIGARSREALPELTESLLDDSPSVRAAASHTIDKIDRLSE